MCGVICIWGGPLGDLAGLGLQLSGMCRVICIWGGPLGDLADPGLQLAGSAGYSCRKAWTSGFDQSGRRSLSDSSPRCPVRPGGHAWRLATRQAVMAEGRWRHLQLHLTAGPDYTWLTPTPPDCPNWTSTYLPTFEHMCATQCDYSIKGIDGNQPKPAKIGANQPKSA